MSTFVPQLKRENAFLGDPLKDVYRCNIYQISILLC